MTLDEITSALKSETLPPDAVLTAGLARADELAPIVYSVAEKFCRGVYLLPAEAELLFYGLHILAAARHPDLFDHVMRMAKLPEGQLEQLFPAQVPTSVKRLLLSVWTGDPNILFDLIEGDEVVADVKWALFDVLARFTFDGRIARERTVAFLERLERDQVFDDEDSAWWGWEDAVTQLGIKQLEPALRRVWSKSIYEHFRSQDWDESLAELERAANDPSDVGVFVERHSLPIEDPVEGVSWVRRREQMALSWEAERERQEGIAVEDDPAESIRLTEEEKSWLAGFLVSPQAPSRTTTFEVLDGLFTALIIGPVVVPPSRYMPVIWGTEDGSGPEWDSMEQLQYFLDLITRHWNAIAARRNADAPHDPFILGLGGDAAGLEWAHGFSAGIALVEAKWDPIFRDRVAAQLVLSILDLGKDAQDTNLDADVRADLLKDLPVLLKVIARYWRNPERSLTPSRPLRTAKVGRNDPCPCGSGKKYKRCCGMAGFGTLH
jgi:uncharacterized protein